VTVCLTMIVRNEAHVIERCLRSHKDVIDYWVIVDTGSTDGTQQIIQQTMDDIGIKGELHERKWVDFGTNKTEMLKLAKGKADYLLQNDADHVWHGQLPEQLTADCYSVEYHYVGTRYGVVCLLADRLDWRYVGVLHEYVESVPVKLGMSAPALPGCWIEVFHEGARSRDPLTYKKDAEILERALEKEPENSRYTFYLAQSYRDGGRPYDAIEMYRRRTRMAGWVEETWFSHYMIGMLLEQSRAPATEVAAAYLAAYQYRPTRAEPLYYLSRLHRMRSEWSLAFLYASHAAVISFPADKLFLEDAVYQWKALDELVISAWWSGKHEVGRSAAEQLLTRPYPASDAQRITTNCGFYGCKALDKIAA
jgi:glycosyltransferase involved in cell wall biosynthesis